MHLLEPLTLGTITARNRLMFGPIVTNLGDDDRAFTDRHVGFYAARAEGGCGIIVTEEASVHPSDWSYERSPLASRCASGWRAIAAACHHHGSLTVAAIGHTGGQGSSAYSQAALWAPSNVAEVNAREVPKSMEDDDIAAVLDGFAAAAATAVDAGCDGVEVNAGQHSLVRQFLSGLTNQRSDRWGSDRLMFPREVLRRVRGSVGTDRVLGLRLSCDELAPWAGVTPEIATEIASALAEFVDYLVVVRGSIYTVEKTRPDFHEPAGFNIELCRRIRQALAPSVSVVLQGSVVDAVQAEWAIGDRVCDAVEMTRAQLADPELGRKLSTVAGGQREVAGEAIRPCIRCNQTCQVRDARNPIITCVVEPSTGHETEDPKWYVPAGHPGDVVIVGGGPAGMEAARVAARRGQRVRLIEAATQLGGNVAHIAHAAPFTTWLADEIARLGVEVHLGEAFAADAGWPEVTATTHLIQCTGSVAGTRPYSADDLAIVLDIAEIRSGLATSPAVGDIAVFDPIGGPIAVAVAEKLGNRAILITHDQISGNELSRTGDLAPANARLQQSGVRIERRTILRHVATDHVVVEDRFTGEQRSIDCVALIDCGFRLPSPPLPGAAAAGDCVAPRTILEAVLEARRAAQFGN